MKKKNTNKLPKVGNKIYVDSQFYISHGSDDVVGGLATVTKVEKEDYGIFVSVKEHPGHAYNWEILSLNQKKLKKQFGKQVAYPQPDIDTPWLEAGDYYSTIDENGKKTEGIYKGPSVW